MLLGTVGLQLPNRVEAMLDLAVDAGTSANVLLAIAAPLLFFFLVMVEDISACHPICRAESFYRRSNCEEEICSCDPSVD